jgi:molybdopterin-guanine dinucleotide biosynthesis protein A
MSANPRPPRGGVIIAGGRSTRFGERDKVLAELAGVPMIRRVAKRLDGAMDELVVNCRANQTEAIERALSGMSVEFAEDPETDLGPIAGAQTGLAALNTEYAAVIAADMPLIDPAFISHLFDRAAGHSAAVPRHDGWLQPTQAVYRTAAMADACAAALSHDDHRLHAVLSDVEYVVVDEDEAREYTDLRTFTNLNTREEFKQVAAEITDTNLAETNPDTDE